MSEWLIAQLGFPWYAYGWPQVLIGMGLLWLLLFLFRVLGRRGLPIKWWLRWGLALPIAVVAVTWDVWLQSRAANQLCREQGGLHVYKTVEVEGFAGATSINYWSQYGFTYVEGYGKRFTLRNGEEHVEDIPEGGGARYSWGTYENYVPVGKRFFRTASRVIDRQTDEVLGKLVTFTGPRGWADNWLPGLLGMEHSPWICGDLINPDKPRYNNHYGYQHIVKATLKPKITSSGAK